MGIKLSKNQKVRLRKESDLKRVRLELKWSAPGVRNFDVDASAFICDLDAKGKPKALGESYFVFYGNETDPQKSVVTGGDVKEEGDADGENIVVDLDRVNAKAQEIAFVLSIHKAASRRQHFGMLQGGGVVLFNDDTNEELGTFEFGNGAYTNKETIIHAASLIRDEDGWDFVPYGEGRPDKDLGDIVTEFGLELE